MFEDGLKITWLGVSAIATGIIVFFVITEIIEPWVVETLCRELVRCNNA